MPILSFPEALLLTGSSSEEFLVSATCLCLEKAPWLTKIDSQSNSQFLWKCWPGNSAQLEYVSNRNNANSTWVQVQRAGNMQVLGKNKLMACTCQLVNYLWNLLSSSSFNSTHIWQISWTFFQMPIEKLHFSSIKAKHFSCLHIELLYLLAAP